VISCRNLTKRFGDHIAVDSLNLSVAAGSICCFLGPNGAGKSTTVKMLTGLLQPTSGQAFIAGHDVAAEPLVVKRLIGVLPESLGLFGTLTVEEHLHLSGPIYGLSREETHSRTDELLRALALDDGRDTFIDHCSYGMRKKTALAMALLHNPQVLFLDEPFEGIDPVASKTLRELMVTLTTRGITVFLTSHILSIVERLASQIVMIRDGHVVWDSRPDELPKSLEDVYFDLVETPIAEELPWLGSSRF
jgi:ABC-2 type transport system ATP-binding protein